MDQQLDSERRQSYREKQETIEKLFDIKVGVQLEPTRKEKIKAVKTIMKDAMKSIKYVAVACSDAKCLVSPLRASHTGDEV